MKFLKTLIIFGTMSVGGALFAWSAQGINLQKCHALEQVAMPCLSEAMGQQGVSYSLHDANTWQEQIFKKFYNDDEALCQRRLHNPHHVARFLSGALIRDDGFNIVDTEKIYNSPLAFPGAVLYFRMEDMSKIMARE